jgi:hypothetical protein
MRVTKRHPAFRFIRLLLVGTIVALAWLYGWAPTIIPPADSAYVGLTREQIIKRIGAPDGRWAGNYGNPSWASVQQYQPCESFAYRKWHGTVFISVYQKNGQWVCYCSNWLPRGSSY